MNIADLRICVEILVQGVGFNVPELD